MQRVDLTVGITAHNEGVVAHKTMLSVFAAIENVKKVGANCEILVNIDNGDEETKKYFSRYEKRKNIRIFNNNFGDLGQSRNFIVNEACGEFVGFIDADDLISDNWFLESIMLLRKNNDNIVVHPEASLTFGADHHVLWVQHSSFGKLEDLLLLCGVNRWISICVASRNVFLNTPYPLAGHGYGNEDWWFNTETESKLIRHVVAKNTIQFYRRKNTSLLMENNGKNLIQWHSQLFDIRLCRTRYKEINTDAVKKIPSINGKRRVYRIYKKIRDSRASFFIDPIARPIKIIVDKIQDSNRPEQEKKKHIPGFIIKEWKKITKIEPQLYPTEQEQKNVVRYYSDEEDEVGRAYLKCISKVEKMPDYVFIVPWLVAGGADKVMLNYIKALSLLHKDWSFAVITTLPARNSWECKLPNNAYVVDFGNNSNLLMETEKGILFARILTQLGCKKIHLINSEFGYRWINMHKKLIADNYKLNVSVFCYDYMRGTKNEAVFDYMDPYLVSIYDVVDRIFTDNEAIVKRGVMNCGFDKNKFKVHYQPFSDKLGPTRRKGGEKVRVLWAGRIAYQKCPEILCKIAKEVGDNVEIDVFGRLDGYDKGLFDGISNLKYRGKYDGFNSLDTNSYNLYLYTSNIDGIPNCLLEAAAAGLPIIAPNVGGIGEFIINKKTGVLIDKYDDIDAFVKAIDFAEKHPETMQKYAKNAQNLLRKQHSWDTFIENVKHDFGKE